MVFMQKIAKKKKNQHEGTAARNEHQPQYEYEHILSSSFVW